MVGHRSRLDRALSLALTVGRALDYLLTGADLAVANVTVNGQSVDVVDGQALELSNQMFCLGLDAPPPEPSGSETVTVARITMGAYQAQEQYVIPGYIDLRIGGATTKQVRDVAEGVFNSFWNYVAADPSLGGLLPGGGANVTGVTESPQMVGTAAEPAARMLLTFVVTCSDLQLA